MTAFLARAWAFVVRDFLAETSYRLYFLMQVGGLAWTLLLFYFVSRLVGPGLPELSRYGGSYFGFVLLGYAPLEYLRVGVMGFSSRIRQAQEHGTLEALLVTRAGIPTIVFGSVGYWYLWSTLRSVLFLALGASAASGSNVRLGAVAAFLALSVVAFGSIGILSASFVMVFKKGDPISLLFLGTSTLFSGLLFPVSLLGRLEVVSWALPLTWSMEGIRQAALGRTLPELWREALVLAGFCAVLVPLAAWSFRHALDRARRDGTLSHY